MKEFSLSIGTVAFVALLWCGGGLGWFWTHSQNVNGTVIALTPLRQTFVSVRYRQPRTFHEYDIPTITFPMDTRTIRFDGDPQLRGRLAVGKIVRVRYPPKSPERARIVSPLMILWPLFWSILTGIFYGGAWIFHSIGL